MFLFIKSSLPDFIKYFTSLFPINATVIPAQAGIFFTIGTTSIEIPLAREPQ